jgi:hypothetical protein
LLYRFALPTANHVFLPGHRIMVQIQSSWFPLYDRNPQTFVPQYFLGQAGRLPEFESRLDIHVEINHVRNKLRVRLRLIEAAHDSEGDGSSLSLHESRDDGVQGTFARRKRVGLAGREGEGRGAVVKHKAGMGWDEPAAEGSGIALDQRNFIAIPIDDREIGRIACKPRQLRLQLGGQNIALRSVFDQLGAFSAGFFRNQLLDRYLAELRVCDVVLQVGIGQFLRFDFDVQRLRAIVSVLAPREIVP